MTGDGRLGAQIRLGDGPTDTERNILSRLRQPGCLRASLAMGALMTCGDWLAVPFTVPRRSRCQGLGAMHESLALASWRSSSCRRQPSVPARVSPLASSCCRKRRRRGNRLLATPTGRLIPFFDLDHFFIRNFIPTHVRSKYSAIRRQLSQDVPRNWGVSDGTA